MKIKTNLNCLLSLGILLTPGLQAEKVEKPRPNIIHIMVDDMAADALGYRGRFPFLKTPNLDRLADNGIVFNEFFVTTSLCSPSRASILTGRYAHLTGVPDNSDRRDPDPLLPTYPKLLQEAGYVTAHVGKWHMGDGNHPREGYTHWFAFEGQGDYFNPTMNRNGIERVVEGYNTDILTDETVALLKTYKDKPFAINLWYKAAHGPFEPAPRHEGIFDEVDFPKPATWDDDLRDQPAWMRRSRAYGGVHLETWKQSEGKPIPEAVPAKPFNTENTRTARNHLSTLLAVDDSVGRVMAALNELGLMDKTIVIFTADNGFFLGEFARGDKRLPDDASIRVPMIIHYPFGDGEARSLSAMGLNIDFAPTILDWAGIEIPDTMQGYSLHPLIEGTREKLRDYFAYVYFQEEYAPGIPTTLALRTERWKYIHYPYEKEPDRLYDLLADPHEQFNLAGDARHAQRMASFKTTLTRELERLDYREPSYRYLPPGG